MVTEPLLQMLPEVDVRTILGDGLRGGSNMNMEDSLVNDIESMLREHQSNANMDRERDLNIFRSGSAPPTVEGSLNAVGSLFRNSDTQFAGINRNDHSNGILSEEEIRSHPAYLQYYYSHDNLNPRLPPPLLSKEDWRIARRFQNGSTSYVGIGDRRNELVLDDGGNKSLFSLQPGGLPSPNKDMGFGEVRKVTPRHPRQPSAEWIEKGTDGLIGLAGVGLGERRKSLADMLQEGLGRPAPIPGHHSRPASRNSFDSVVDPVISAPIPGHHSRPASRNSFDGVLDPLASGPQLAQLQNGVDSLDGLHSGATAPGLVRVRSLGSSISHSFASAVVGASLSRSPTPEAPLVGRSTTPSLPPQAGRVAAADKEITAGSNVYTDHSSGMGGHADVAHSLSFLSLSASSREDSSVQAQMEQEFKNQPNLLFGMPNGHCQRVQQHFIGSSGAKMQNIPTIYEDMAKTSGAAANVSQFNMDEQMNLPKTSSAAGPYTNVSSADSQSLEGSSIQYKNAEMKRMTISGHSSSRYPLNQRENPSMTNHHDAGNPEGQNLNRNGNHAGSAFQAPLVDPLYVQYLQRTSDVAALLNDPTLGRNYMNTSNTDLIGFQKAYIAALVAQQKQQYGMPFLGKSGGLNQGYYGSPTFGVGMPYPGSPIATSVLPSLGPGTPIQQNERIAGFPSMMTSPAGGSMGSWQSVNGRNIEENSSSSLLEEFKNNKTRCFELSEIIDHAVEFSTDQYGSRFIQQKLETATNEEKNKIFPEITPHAHALMTDVFGNYVIQKFFEYGTESQRKELTSQLTGHILPLSLQMYGCRVIQKALEVVDVDRQTQMVAELDGSVMKCVRDQNGNHVIQKCIECVPQDRIQFIITAFYGQVVPLSTHPYGCRVIQRVLEHCDDANTQRIVMEEIMHSVCTLAQDQYGNYVVQHVLQHGKPHERSAIISKLAGQIIKMSQQKFASNVVEKCLTFGGPDERQLLMNEMLGSTDENEPLQAMMKDPYGNYVVQKVLETCDNQSRELILSRIKVHLNTLKRYTYGKHIVARVEKLITAGERRMGIAASQSA